MKLPANSPHYPGLHNLWSRVWTAGDEAQDSPLGEDLETEHIYDFGNAEAEIPPPVLIGDAECIRDGERLPLPIVTRTFPGGWDSRCYQFRPPEAQPFPWPISINDCHWQHRIAQAIDLIYTQNAAAAVAYLTPFLPGASFVSFDNTASVLPGCVIVLYADFAAILMAGTTTPQQWALQGMTGLLGLQDYSQFSTLKFWFDSAMGMSDRFYFAGAGDPPQLLFAGHSYGGALACIMAARARLASNSRGIQLITYGCPKPGDQRLVDILGSVRQWHFVNEDDPVTFIPPSSTDLGVYAAFIPEAYAERWSGWTRPTGLVRLSMTGVRRDSPLPDSMYTLLLRMVRQVITSQQIEVIMAHLTSEYARRIQCPADPVPGPDPGIQPGYWFDFRSIVGYADGDNLDHWEDLSLYGNDATVVGGNPTFTLTSAFPEGLIPIGSIGQFMGLTVIQPHTVDFCGLALVYISPATSPPWEVYPFGFNSSLFHPLRIRRTQLRSAGSGFSVQQTIPALTAGLHFFAVRKEGAQLTFQVDSTVYGPLGTSSTGSIVLLAIGVTASNPVTPSFSAWLSIAMFQGKVTASQLTDFIPIFLGDIPMP